MKLLIQSFRKEHLYLSHGIIQSASRTNEIEFKLSVTQMCRIRFDPLAKL